MKTSLITTIADSIIRPNTCFANVSEDAKSYFIFSVIIFVIAGASSLFSDAINMAYWNSDGKNHLGFSPVSISLSVIHAMLQNFVIIAGIFWIGKKLGGSTNFKKIFSVISFCLIPAIIASFVVPLVLTLASQILLETDVHSIDPDSDISPSYALDFASSTIISNGFAITFGAWILVLFLKATKIVHAFDTKKSVITVVSGIGIMFLSQTVFGMSSSLLLYL